MPPIGGNALRARGGGKGGPPTAGDGNVLAL